MNNFVDDFMDAFIPWIVTIGIVILIAILIFGAIDLVTTTHVVYTCDVNGIVINGEGELTSTSNERYIINTEEGRISVPVNNCILRETNKE